MMDICMGKAKRENVTCSLQQTLPLFTYNYLQAFIRVLFFILSSLLFIFPLFFVFPLHSFSHPLLSWLPFLLSSLPSSFPFVTLSSRPCPRLSPSSALALCRNSTLSHSERLTLPSCFPVLLHCCHGETLCVYPGVCVCACLWASSYVHSRWCKLQPWSVCWAGCVC